MNFFGKDVAVSLVDDSFMFATQAAEEPLILPAYVAFQTNTTHILAYGEEARVMQGREPDAISVARVMENGVIADQQTAEALFRFGLRKVLGGRFMVRPRVVIALLGKEPGKWSVKQMGTMGGAREVYLMEMGMASAVGMGLEVEKPEIRAVLSISDDWFEFSVISLAGVLSSAHGSIGSRTFAEDIQNHLMLARRFRPDFHSLLAQLVAEGVRHDVVADLPGWESWAGRTEQGRLITHRPSQEDFAIGLMPSLTRLIERIKSAIRSLPSEKQYSLSQTTIHATGSSLRIPGLSKLIASQLGYSVTPYPSASHPSIEGAKRILRELNVLRRMVQGTRAGIKGRL